MLANSISLIAFPALTIFLPIANAGAGGSITSAKANLQCMRAFHVNAGAETPSAAPAPTPLYGGLSGGEKAGIAVGVIVGIALLAGMAYFYWRRRRRTPKLQTFDLNIKQDVRGSVDGREDELSMMGKAGAADEKSVPEAASTPVKELRPDTEVAKFGTYLKPAELSPVDVPAETGGGTPRAELSADEALRKS